MSLIQKLKVDHLIFSEIALSRVLREGDGSSRIDVVFDVSIKSADRELRSEEDFITFKNVSSGQKVKQF